MTADWIIKLLILAAVMAVGYAAYRRRWPPSPKIVLVTIDDDEKKASDEPGKPAPTPAPAPTVSAKTDESKKKRSSGGGILSGILSFAGLLLLLVLAWGWVILPIIHWWNQRPTTQVASHSRVVVNKKAITLTRTVYKFGCPLVDMEWRACELPTDKNRLMQRPGLPAGLTFCLNPGPDAPGTQEEDKKWERFDAVFDNGSTQALDPEHPFYGIAGYEVTPKHPMTIAYRFSKFNDCT